MSDQPPAGEPFTKEELKRAYSAFKKRMKLTRLDDESKVGHGPMSGGGRSGVVAISPPNQFPKEIWQELCRQGKLKQAGHGMYEMVGG
jgi:hypothetical protein